MSILPLLVFAGTQVVPTASSLNTNDVFVLKSPSSLFTWVGKGATPEEKVAAQYVAGLLGGAATEVEESKEPGELGGKGRLKTVQCKMDKLSFVLVFVPAGFWTALGGKKDYQTSVALQKTVKPPRLFGCSNKTGTLIVSSLSFCVNVPKDVGCLLYVDACLLPVYLNVNRIATSQICSSLYLGRGGARRIHADGSGTR